MNILLLGHKGYLGSYLHRSLSYKHDVLPKNNEYDYIINCIGKPDLEYCETHPEISKVSNYTVIKPYVERYPNSKIINFSSYYVYDSAGFCFEYSNITENYFYTHHNLLCERFITRNNGVTFRLGKLFGNSYCRERGKLTEYIIQKEEMILDSVLFNPVSVSQIKKIIEHELKNKYMTGIYNLSNDGYASHYDYGLFINEMLGTNKSLTKIKKMKRSFHNYGNFLMSVDKLKNDINLTSWELDLYKYLGENNV